MITVTLDSFISGEAPSAPDRARLFKYEGNVRLELETNVSLASAILIQIRYRSPSGILGYWSGIASGTKVQVDLDETTLNETGEWLLQSYFSEYGSPLDKSTYGAYCVLDVELPVYFVSPALP